MSNRPPKGGGGGGEEVDWETEQRATTMATTAGVF